MLGLELSMLPLQACVSTDVCLGIVLACPVFPDAGCTSRPFGIALCFARAAGLAGDPDHLPLAVRGRRWAADAGGQAAVMAWRSGEEWSAVQGCHGHEGGWLTFPASLVKRPRFLMRALQLGIWGLLLWFIALSTISVGKHDGI